MKQLSFLVGIGLLLLLIPGPSPADTPPPEVIAAAESGLAEFLSRIPPGELELLGFPPGSDPSAASLGDPWPLYTIPPDRLLAAPAGVDTDSLISPTGIWYFPILLDGSFRAVLAVEEMDGEWAAVNLGMAPLARQLELLAARWPGAEGFTPRLILVYQAGAYLFTVPQEGPDNLTPLALNGADFAGRPAKSGPAYAEIEPLSAILGPLQAATAAGLDVRQPGTVKN